MTDLDALAQPACPECGTVLRDIRGGFRCPSCELAFLPDLAPMLPAPAMGDPNPRARPLPGA